METDQYDATAGYHCPRCESDVVFAHGSWGCLNCTYVPTHGAD
jgi:ribosomal protein L37AE/L43A